MPTTLGSAIAATADKYSPRYAPYNERSPHCDNGPIAYKIGYLIAKFKYRVDTRASRNDRELACTTVS